jgi:hypothetical protein
LDQVPEVAVEILPNRDAAIGLVGGWADPCDPGGGEGGVVAGKIVGGEEEEHAAAGLVADVLGLMVGGGAGEEDGGGVRAGVGRANRYPALVLFGLLAVLDQRETELADVEGERLVIVADDEAMWARRGKCVRYPSHAGTIRNFQSHKARHLICRVLPVPQKTHMILPDNLRISRD